MLARLPIAYALLVIAQVVWLTRRFLNDQPKPSDPLSIWLGWAGLGAMVVMLVYSIARRSPRLRKVARLSYWLHLHIFLGVAGVVCVFFHSIHVFTRDAPLNWLNPGLLNFIAVMIVFFSGIFGRYMYSLVPRTLGGEQMAASDVEREIDGMTVDLPDGVKALWTRAPDATSLVGLVQADLQTRQAIRAIAKMGLVDEVRQLAERRVRLERRLAAWQAADSLFRNWIILHRPLAGIMYVLSAVHIILSYMFSPAL